MVKFGMNGISTCKSLKSSGQNLIQKWKKKYDVEGKEGLKGNKPILHSHPNITPPEVIKKILELRKNYQLNPERIKWYLER